MSSTHLLSQIPSVEILLHETESEKWTAGIPRRILVDSIRAAVEKTRAYLLESATNDVNEDDLRRTILQDVRRRA